MKPTSRFSCLWLAAFMTVTPYTPSQFLQKAKLETDISSKIILLRRLIESFPLDGLARTARENLIALLAGSNRYEEALQEYRKDHPQTGSGDAIDFTLIDYLLKTGRYNDVLRATSAASGPIRDFLRDEKLMELRVQAMLAKGRYQLARECVEDWLAKYEGDGIEGSRFEGDVRAIDYLRHHLLYLERTEGAKGKAIFTASVPDSLQHWSHRQDVPIVFFKLIPAHPPGQLYEPVLPGRHETDPYFEGLVDEMNRGFGYLSNGAFSLKFAGLHTLYVKQGDMDPSSTGGNLVTSRVYIHTIPELYKLAGEAFVMLVDYRDQSEGEAAYMGDGLIHISASKLKNLVMMHEILHGLGATHKDWNYLEGQGYRFDSDDRGLMTFERGELKDLGLEEKNRAVLGWPQVSVVRLNNEAPTVSTPSKEPPVIATARVVGAPL
jgi:hypothetical protein